MPQNKLVRLRQQVGKFGIKDWKQAVLASVFLACLGILSYKVYTSWEALRAFEWRIKSIWLVPSFLLFLLQTLFVLWGWWSIAGRLAPKVPFRKHVQIYCYTNLARRLPASLLWLVAGRAYWYRQLDTPASAAAVASFLELALAILLGIPIAVLQISTIASLEPAVTIILFMLSTALVGMLIQPKLLNQLGRVFKKEELGLNLSYRDSLRWATVYIFIWLLGGAGLFMVINLFYTLPLRSLPEIIGVWVLSSLISYLTLLTPSGFGVKELSLTFLLGAYLPDPLPMVVALAIRMLWTAYDIFVGLIPLLL